MGPGLTPYSCRSKYCPNGRTCYKIVDPDDLYEFKYDFWNELDEDAPTSKLRYEKIEKIVRRSYVAVDKKFKFHIQNKFGEVTPVCEGILLLKLI